MRVRLRFTKLGKIRFTGHRDVARLFERALRRAALPLAMTEGFSPRPKVHFGLALSTGYESMAEYLDVDLREGEADHVQIEALPGRLSALLPPGLDVVNAAVVDRREMSLQQAVTSCTWQLDVVGDGGENEAEDDGGVEPGLGEFPAGGDEVGGEDGEAEICGGGPVGLYLGAEGGEEAEGEEGEGSPDEQAAGAHCRLRISDCGLIGVGAAIA